MEHFDLDRIDRALLAALQKDARRTNKELAAEVGLAPSSCHARLARLVESGAITGFHARISPQALGIGLQMLVSVRLAQHGRDTVAAFHDHIAAQPEVIDIFHLAGADDVQLHVVVRDADHLRAFVMNTLSDRPEVAHMESHLVYDHVRAEGLPDLTEGAKEKLL